MCADMEITMALPTKHTQRFAYYPYLLEETCALSGKAFDTPAEKIVGREEKDQVT